MVQDVACPSCKVSVYDLRTEQELAKQYGVNAVSAIAIDGTLVLTGKSTRKQLQAADVGQPLNGN